MSVSDEVAKLKAEFEAKLDALRDAAKAEVKKLETWAKGVFGDAAKPADGSDFTVQVHDDAATAIDAAHAALLSTTTNENGQVVQADAPAGGAEVEQALDNSAQVPGTEVEPAEKADAPVGGA